MAKNQEKVQSDKETLTKLNNQYNTLQNMLVNDDVQLTVLYDRKNKDAEFHFGRLTSTREQTLSNDQRNIDNLKIQMENIKNKMLELKQQAQQYK